MITRSSFWLPIIMGLFGGLLAVTPLVIFAIFMARVRIFFDGSSANDTLSIFSISLGISLLVAIGATIASYSILMAFRLSRLVDVISIALALPLMVPYIMVALGMAATLGLLGWQGGMGWILVGHLWMAIPISFFLLARARERIEPELFWHIDTLPGPMWRRHVFGYTQLLRSPLLVIAFLTGIISLEESVVAWYVGGFTKTFSVVISNELRGSFSATILIAGGILWVVELCLLGLIRRIIQRDSRNALSSLD